MSPLCVLDFYVAEEVQRKGYGKRMFEKMLEMENVNPTHLAIDKPSEKSIRFLRKHYNLKNPIGQVNNFVVFDGFFDNRPTTPGFLYKRNQSKKYEMTPYSAAPLQYGSNRFLNSDVNNNNNLPPLSNLDKNQQHRTGSVDSRLPNNRYEINL